MNLLLLVVLVVVVFVCLFSSLSLSLSFSLYMSHRVKCWQYTFALVSMCLLMRFCVVDCIARHTVVWLSVCMCVSFFSAIQIKASCVSGNRMHPQIHWLRCFTPLAAVTVKCKVKWKRHQVPLPFRHCSTLCGLPLLFQTPNSCNGKRGRERNWVTWTVYCQSHGCTACFCILCGQEIPPLFSDLNLIHFFPCPLFFALASLFLSFSLSLSHSLSDSFSLDRDEWFLLSDCCCYTPFLCDLFEF